MSDITLSGLSPDSPLGVRAAVGLLSVCERIYPGSCRLSWQPMQAVLHTRHTCHENELVEALDEDHRRRGTPAWLDWEKDIRVPAETYCELLAASDRGTQDVLAALGHEYNTDKNGKLRSTAWRMYGVKERAGWLEAIAEVASSMTTEKWREALFGPWRYEDKVSPLGWDPNVVQRHAEQARSSSATKTIATVGAVWLAALSLPLFPVFLGERRLVTTGIVGDAFYWPIWTQPATLATVRFLLHLDCRSLSPQQRQALGVRQLWRSRIIHVGDRRALEAGELVA
jgi:hypothetical protein